MFGRKTKTASPADEIRRVVKNTSRERSLRAAAMRMKALRLPGGSEYFREEGAPVLARWERAKTGLLAHADPELPGHDDALEEFMEAMMEVDEMLATLDQAPG